MSPPTSTTTLNLFPPSPSHSHPHFETYKLASTPHSPITYPHPASYNATTSRLRLGLGVGVKEMKARVGWDHLSLGGGEGEVVYIGEGYDVIKVAINDDLTPTYKILTTLPTPLPSSTSTPRPSTSNTSPDPTPPLPEFPSVISLPTSSSPSPSSSTSTSSSSSSQAQAPSIYFASTGTGTLHVISERPTTEQMGGEGRVVEEEEYELIIPSPAPNSTGAGTGNGDGNGDGDDDEVGTDADIETSASSPTQGIGYPFLLHTARRLNPTTAEVIITRTIRQPQPQSPSRPVSTHTAASTGLSLGLKVHTAFEIISLLVPLPQPFFKSTSTAVTASVAANTNTTSSNSKRSPKPKMKIQWRLRGDEFPIYIARALAPSPGPGPGPGSTGSTSNGEVEGGRWIIAGGVGAGAGLAGGSKAAWELLRIDEEGREVLPSPAASKREASGGAGIPSNAAPLPQGKHDPQSQTENEPPHTHPHPYPYEWSQTHSTLTLTFPTLPATLNPQRDVICLLRPSTLGLGIFPRGGDGKGTGEGKANGDMDGEKEGLDGLDGLDEVVKRFLASGERENVKGRDGKPTGVGRWDWWDAIKGDESTWTWTKPDSAGRSGSGSSTAAGSGAGSGSGFGVLEITLEKLNEGVRWPSVFAPRQENDPDDEGLLPVAGNSSNATVQDDAESKGDWKWDVPETLTDEQREEVRRGLEGLHQTGSAVGGAAAAAKYAGLGHASFGAPTTPTASTSTSRLSSSIMGHGSAQDPLSATLPGLLAEEMEDEDDYDMEDEYGDDLHLDGGEFGSLGGGGGSRAGREVGWCYVEDDRGKGVKLREFPKAKTVSVLSTGFEDRSRGGAGQSVIIKSFVDGQVFVPPANPRSADWTHLSTNPALSFVLASKKDVQLVYHDLSSQDQGEALVYVFESRQNNGMGGNLYIYYPVEGATVEEKKKVRQAKQTVLKFGEGAVGGLMGVKMVRVGRERRKVLVGLLEGAFVVMAV